MTGASLGVDGLGVTYRSRSRVVVAATEVSFDVPAGGSLAVVGESGSGKSTVARAVAGVVPTTSGTITIDGVTRRFGPGRGHDVPDGVPGPFDGFESTAHGRQQSDRDPPCAWRPGPARGLVDRRSTCSSRSAWTPGSSTDGRPGCRVVSGSGPPLPGHWRPRPGILVADEATSALDVTTQAAILRLFDRLRHEVGCTLVVVTHNIAVAQEICHDVVVMSQGRVVEQGSCDRVFNRPRHPYTAELLSSVLPMPTPPARDTMRDS